MLNNPRIVVKLEAESKVLTSAPFKFNCISRIKILRCAKIVMS
nr:MAG TPA: hypothetical protein [Caudoviricetes sp.]